MPRLGIWFTDYAWREAAPDEATIELSDGSEADRGLCPYWLYVARIGDATTVAEVLSSLCVVERDPIVATVDGFDPYVVGVTTREVAAEAVKGTSLLLEYGLDRLPSVDLFTSQGLVSFMARVTYELGHDIAFRIWDDVLEVHARLVADERTCRIDWKRGSNALP